MTSQYPALDAAYQRIVGPYSVPALVDYLRPAGRYGMEFDQVAHALNKVLSEGGENARYLDSREGIEPLGVVYNGDDVAKAFKDALMNKMGAYILPSYSWVSDYDWSEYLSECAAAGMPTGYELMDSFDIAYYEDPTYFIGFAEADLVLWAILSMYLDEAGVRADEIESDGAVFIALREGDNADFFP